jgi:hypothetical protein
MSLCDSIIWCELSRVSCFFLKSVSCLSHPTPRTSNDTRRRPRLPLHMWKVWAQRKSTPQNGVHNRGGKKAKSPELSQEQTDAILNQPASRFFKGQGRAHISKLAAGSDTRARYISGYVRAHIKINRKTMCSECLYSYRQYSGG